MPKIPEHLMFNTGVYRWKNLVNGKVYIGGAYGDFDKRKTSHIGKLRKSIHGNSHLQAAWNLYGEQSFVFEIIVRVPPDKVQVHEQMWIDRYFDGGVNCYNLSPTAGSIKGLQLSLEQRASKKERMGDVETRIKLILSHVGKKDSEETRRKKSMAHKGRKKSPEIMEALRQSRIGCRHTEETKARIAAKKRGKRLSKEHREAIGCGLIGNKNSEGSSRYHQ